MSVTARVRPSDDMTVAPTSGEPLASYNWPRTSRTVGL